jgi:hypothetical protein
MNRQRFGIQPIMELNRNVVRCSIVDKFGALLRMCLRGAFLMEFN